MISHIMLRQDGNFAGIPLGCLDVNYQDFLAIWRRGPISSPASGYGIEWHPIFELPVIGRIGEHVGPLPLIELLF